MSEYKGGKILVFSFLNKPKQKYKYILFEGLFLTDKCTVFDTYEEARKNASFKCSIYKVPEYLIDEFNSIVNYKGAWHGKSFCINNKKCELEYIGKYEDFYRSGTWA